MKNIILIFCLLTFGFTASAKNKTWVCIDESGKEQFRIEAVSVDDFHNGLAKIYKNTWTGDRWISGYGFIDRTGKMVIEADLYKADPFYAHATWIQKAKGGKSILIDKFGTIIPTKEYTKVQRFSKFQTDLCAVYQNKKMGWIDSTGTEVIPCKFDGTSIFSEGLVCVTDPDKDDSKYGFINKKGELVIPMKFKQSGVSSFQHGLARMMVAGSTVLIDKTGKTIFETSKGNIQGYTPGKVLIFTGRDRTDWGVLNMKNEFVVQPIYDYMINYSESGYAIVEKNGLKGAIDTSGKIVLEIKYTTAYADPKNDGFLIGAYPSPKGTSLSNMPKDYFDINLKKINLNGIKHISHGNGSGIYIYSNHDGKYGFLNSSFKVFLPAQYNKVKNFSEGLAWANLSE